MNTITIVVLSLLAGLMLALVIAACAYLAWSLHQARAQLAHTQTESLHLQEQLRLLSGDIRTMLDSHHARFQEIVAKINADRLATASTEAIQAARRIERAAAAIGELVAHLLSGEELEERLQGRGTGTTLAPEEYAQETGERFVSVNKTGRGDRQDLSEDEPESS